MGSSEYRNTANKIEQTLHHPKKYYQHTHTVILFLDLLGVSGFWKKKKNSKPLLLHFKYNLRNMVNPKDLAFFIINMLTCVRVRLYSTFCMRLNTVTTKSRLIDK